MEALEVTPNSSPERSRVGRRKDPQKSRVANGSAWLTGVDGRSSWVRRFRDCLGDHLSDIPDASSAERSIIRRASVLEVELERLETKFAQQGEASSDDLD